MSTSTPDGYPLTDVELTRWNAVQRGRDALCCPRHPAEALVGGAHEATGDPAWLCAVCGYITPVVDADLATVLGATDVYTEAATKSAMRPDGRLLIPDHPARTAEGTLAIRTVAPAVVATISGVLATIVMALVLPWFLVALCVGVIAGVGAFALCAIATRHMLPAASTPLLRGSRTATLVPPAAVDLAAGHWVSVQLHHGTPRLAPRLTRSAARVMQTVRCGGTDMLRITTTAGVITTSAHTRTHLVVMEPLAAGMTDYTYLLPSNRTE